ncbi:queuine tRNA-ribosyltransferase catalytic subunit isoform X1 [Colletes gigas]|uniref:queuine tRNA-ribosyltransferase catalytic subunit isoform X1 n=2 Tax=Colletes gigas TaxID=935657 RepID=UPI001C9A6F3F|nr:queuine tRNA-ribosyltransferase catalytic subunit isoform X1 [Colletes gigas]XP_043251923.1 queuine tRNA-ribosyltransferase catalytic subunit isoform X1 [Colletes gigas]
MLASSTEHLVNLKKPMTDAVKSPLIFEIFYECQTTKARAGRMTLVHYPVDTPVFMPVGTQGTLKGLLPQQLEQLNCQIILANTYHLGTRPGLNVIQKAGGLHNFMNWRRALLTDSGGFQMVSLLELAKITEEGVKFKSPYNESDCMLSPEHSIQIQNAIGADIIMQLDDVVSSTLTGPRVEEAMHRTTRWLDRCLSAHERSSEQSVFPIVQGGLDPKLRTECANKLIKRKVNGYAVGGLSGGESKHDFWKMVHISTDVLPKDKPRYLMGVGFAIDIIICSALGIDMFDCVFPTRTARFGCALVRTGQLNLKQIQYHNDMRPIDESCECNTCKIYTRAYLHHIVTIETVACHLLSVHNIAFQMKLMQDIRRSIMEQNFPKFIQQYMLNLYPDKNYPSWIINVLETVNVKLL